MKRDTSYCLGGVVLVRGSSYAGTTRIAVCMHVWAVVHVLSITATACMGCSVL